MERNAVLSLVESVVETVKTELDDKIKDLVRAFENISPPKVDSYPPVTIVPGVQSTHTDLNLIKSLPEFKGNIREYPAWRTAAKFAIDFYVEGSEAYYVAIGILRNKITQTANENLSSFNTPLNFNAIIFRLDQLYADKRPLYILENELNTLRQGRLTIDEYYAAVDKQLTLIINKNIMTNSGNETLTSAFNERARENALRVFISGLRRPLCDTLFSASPPDLPSALAIAQELQHIRSRYEFAQTYASASRYSNNQTTPNTQPSNYIKYSQPTRTFQPKPIPMDVDYGSSHFKNQSNFQNKPANQFDQQKPRNISNQSQQVRYATQVRNEHPKRAHTGNTSTQLPYNKIQRINAMDNQSYYSENFESQSIEEVNFLE
uniref:Retrovirus-related Gag polyprotein from transposon gypsy n=1 Tax=Ceratitis capitata TaxID=7213 RepID=W8C9C9_CERCA